MRNSTFGMSSLTFVFLYPNVNIIMQTEYRAVHSECRDMHFECRARHSKTIDMRVECQD